MKRLKLAQFTAMTGGLVAALQQTAAAHPGHFDATSQPVGNGFAHAFSQGWMHPLLGLDHLLAMVAVGMLAVRVCQSHGDRRELWMVPGAFLASMFAGGLLALAGVAMPAVEAGILSSVIVLGGLVAIATVNSRLAIAFTAVFALFHGYAHVAEAAAGISALAYAAGFLAATAVLHAVGVVASLAMARLSTATLVRASGAAIAVAGVVLAVAAW